MSLLFSPFVAFLLSAYAGATTSVSAPSYGETFLFEYDLWNAAEDMVTHYLEAQDPIANKTIFSGNSPAGSYTELVRGDLGMLYLYFPLPNGSHWCVAYASPTFSSSSFSFAGMPYIANAQVRGIMANHFRISQGAGSFITGAYTSAVSGVPLSLTSPSQQMIWDFTAFENSTSPPASVFDVPNYCTGLAPEFSSLVQARVMEPSSHVQSTIASFQPPWRAMERSLDPVAAVAAFARLPVFKSAVAGSNALPVALDNSPLATPVRNQGACGSCWAFSSMAAIEVASALKTGSGKPLPGWLSPQHLVDCCGPAYNASALVATKGCLGGWPATAFEFLTQAGVIRDSDYPYAGVNGYVCADSGAQKQHLISGYAAVPPLDVQGIMQAVHDNGAVVSIVQILPDFMVYTGGVYDNPLCTGAQLSHGVTIVGWGTDAATGKDYWLVKNSMGRAWGIGGYFKIRRGVNRCGIDSWAVTPIAM